MFCWDLACVISKALEGGKLGRDSLYNVSCVGFCTLPLRFTLALLQA